MDSLKQEPWRWQSAQAVRVLAAAGGSIEQSCQPAYCYPVSEISQVKSTTTKGWKLISTLPCLQGYHGVLPYGYQDIEQHQRLAKDNRCIFDFFSVFNNRILNQGCEVTLRSHISCLYEIAKSREMKPAKRMLAMSGLSMPRHIPEDNLVRYSAIIARKTTNLELLVKILKDYFDFEFRLEPPLVVRMPLAKDCLTKLTTRRNERTDSGSRLGENTLIGRSGYLLHSCIHVVISARTRQEYQAIINDSSIAPAILEMCRMYFASIARFRLQVQCPRSFLQSPQLSAKPDSSVARLGRLSCLVPELWPHQLITIDYPKDCPEVSSQEHHSSESNFNATA
ncbi:hypothetical protein ACH42_10280 [Endozoicomonas sp. (ex Bugula neritina AB1)]|nr:hypothetical protein ACH42_10280 [Endozoicomonas sp. (ex Bugula neritina AB1)]